MIASQLLYTSWKNGLSTTKGYMVYSKSKDITQAEESEICAVMKYKSPDDLPYTPTLEEIETLFPKIFAYFKLSSGRFCIAQSSYIGQDYTNRWGNYIIHAYVLDDIGDLIPSLMIGANIFRTRLTEEELNADAAPESLPQVDIANISNALTEQEINSFFNTSEKRETLKALAQNVFDAIAGNKHINLFDDLNNMRLWIAALSMIVPQNIMSHVYFSTYAIEMFDQLTLSCKKSSSTINSYAQTYYPNDLVNIDACRNEYNPVTIGCYLGSVYDKLFDAYYECILCVSSVNKLMLDYECMDWDRAYKIVCTRKGELSCIATNDELLDIIRLIAEREPANVPEIFNRLFVNYCSRDIYNGDPTSIAILKTLYPHLSGESKADLLMMYTDSKLEIAGDASLVYNEIKRDCPCKWNDAVMHFLRQSFQEHFNYRFNNAVALLLCNSWISVFTKCNAEQQHKAFDEICALYALLVEAKDTKAIICALDNCKRVDENLYLAVYKSVGKTLRDTLGADSDYLFEYLKLALDKGSLFWYVLLSALNGFPKSEPKCIELFVALQKEQEAKAAHLLKYVDKDERIRRFADNISVYVFENTQEDSLESLISGYTKYIAKGTGSKETIDKCRTIFVEKSRLFLNNCDGKESITCAMALYERLYRDKELIEADKDMLSLISETVYNDNKKDIAFINKSLSKTPVDTIWDFKDSCEKEGIAVPLRALLIFEGYHFELLSDKNEKNAKRVIQKRFDDNCFAFLSDACRGVLLEEFLDNYMGAMLRGMYMIYYENDNLTAVEVIDYFLEPVAKSYNGFDKEILKAWRDDVLITNDNMDLYFSYIFDKTSLFRNELKDNIEEYLVRLGKGKRNALFEALEDYFADSNDASHLKKINRYIDDFNKKHMTMMDKLKSIFIVKEEDEGNGKKK